jgi:hypothetical protein
MRYLLLIVAQLKSPSVQAREPANAGLPLVALVSLAAQGSIIIAGLLAIVVGWTGSVMPRELAI